MHFILGKSLLILLWQSSSLRLQVFLQRGTSQAGGVDAGDRKLLFALDSFGLPDSRTLTKRRKTQPPLEQNVLVKTTDLPNLKHLLIKTMARKPDLFFLISTETLSHASFLTHAQITASMGPASLTGWVSLFSQHSVCLRYAEKVFFLYFYLKVFALLFIGTINKRFKWSCYLSCLSCITMGNLGHWEVSANSWKSTDVCMHSHNIWQKLGLKVTTMKMLFIVGAGLFCCYKTGLFNYSSDWDFASETPARS